MNRWVQRGLRTALLTGGLLAAGAGVASADENDLSADVVGVTATVPVQDGAVIGTPVVTGTGEDLTVGGAGVPVDTKTEPGTTVLGQDGTGGVSVPVRVTKATGTAPDPRDGLTATVPINTSGGGTAGTTVTAPVVTGDLGGVLDGDPLSGVEVDVDLADPVVPGRAGDGVLLDLEDTVTIGNTDGTTSPDTVLAVPAGLDGDRPTTVALPLPNGSGRGPLSGDDVEVGGPVGDGQSGEAPSGDGRPALIVAVDTGDLLTGQLGGDTLSGTTVEVDLDGLLGDGPGSGSVVAVPVNEGRSGTLGDVLVRITLPLDAPGLPGGGSGSGGRNGTGGGSGDGSAAVSSPGRAPGARDGAAGGGTTDGTGSPGAPGSGGTAPAHPARAGSPGVDCRPTGGAPAPAGGGDDGDRSGNAGAAGDGDRSGDAGAAGGRATGPAAGTACASGSPSAVGVRPTSSMGGTDVPVPAAASAVAVAVGLLLAAGRGRLWRDRAGDNRPAATDRWSAPGPCAARCTCCPPRTCTGCSICWARGCWPALPGGGGWSG
jgi:hypothetical protein